MKALQGPGAAPVQRVRMSNLVIFCNSQEQADRVNAQAAGDRGRRTRRGSCCWSANPAPDERDVTASVRVRPLHMRRAGARAWRSR